MIILATCLALKCQLSLLLLLMLLLLFERQSHVTKGTDILDLILISRIRLFSGMKVVRTVVKSYPSVQGSLKTISWHGHRGTLSFRRRTQKLRPQLSGRPSLQPECRQGRGAPSEWHFKGRDSLNVSRRKRKSQCYCPTLAFERRLHYNMLEWQRDLSLRTRGSARVSQAGLNQGLSCQARWEFRGASGSRWPCQQAASLPPKL